MSPFLRRFVAAFSVCLLLAVPLAAQETTEQLITRLLREASGQQPVKLSTGPEAPLEDALRQFFRDIATANRAGEEAQKKLDVSAVEQLYTAESFADPQMMRKIVSQLGAVLDADLKQENEVSRIMDSFRQRVRALSDVPTDVRDGLLAGFDKGVAPGFLLRRRVLSAERSWIESTQDLYSYSLEHARVIQVVSGQVAIDDDAVLAGFNQRIERSQTAQQFFLDTQEDVESKMELLQNNTGVKRTEWEKLRK